MTHPRSPEQTDRLHRIVYNLWRIKQLNADKITDEINGNNDLLQQVGVKVSVEGVRYHLKQIREEAEKMVSETALDYATADYMRLKDQVDDEIIDVNEMIETLDKEKDKELWLKMKRFKKELMETRHKILMDSEVPVQVKKLKKQRDRIIQPIPLVKLENKENAEGVTGQGND